MKLTTRQDIEAPLAQVWATVADFEAWERAAMRRGVEVERSDALRAPAAGMGWKARFRYRGKERRIEIGLTRLEAPHHLDMKIGSPVVEGDVVVELIEMAAKRTRMHITAELRPLSLGARLFLQSLRLARARIDRKFNSRAAQLAREIEARARRLSSV
ncbi:MAG: SRPBCC family protein [Rhodobacteraceae bacterium]|nr:SRPBCC family protein [Paracoccaceae bacterium]